MDVLSNLWYIHYYTFCFILRAWQVTKWETLQPITLIWYLILWWYWWCDNLVRWKFKLYLNSAKTYVPHLCLSMAVSLNFHPIITTHGRSDARDSEYSCYNIDWIITNCLYIFPSPSGTRLGTPITNDAPYVSCHEVKSTHLHGRTPRRGVQCPLTWEFRFDWMGVAPLILHSNNCSRLYFIPAALRSFSSGKYIFFVRRYFIYFTEYVFF